MKTETGVIDKSENAVLMPELYCLTQGAEIFYYYADAPENVYAYTEPLRLTDNCILYFYAEKDGVKSSENVAFYRFIPLPPVIKPVSGLYENKVDVRIYENPLSPIGANHVIYYNKSTEAKAVPCILAGLLRLTGMRSSRLIPSRTTIR